MADTTIKIHNALMAANIEYTGYSCDGVNIFGDSDSIKAAQSAFHSHSQIDNLKVQLRHWREECGKLQAKLAAERERCALVVERADNTMMNQDKLANAIRGH